MLIMTQTKISKAYQTTISAEAIRVLGLRPGQRVNQIVDGKRLILELVEDVDALAGSLGKGGVGTPSKKSRQQPGRVLRWQGRRDWRRQNKWLFQSPLMRMLLSAI